MAMLPLVQVACEELKAADPANVVIGPNVTTLGLRFLNDFLVAGGGKCIDGLSAHLYYGRTPANSGAVLKNLRQLVASHGLQLPIWNTETGVSCNGVAEDCTAVARGGAGVLAPQVALAQGLIGQAALGAMTNAYYTWEGAASESGGRPLVSADYAAPTVEGLAVARVRDWIDGASLRWGPSTDPQFTIIAVRRGEGEALIAWANGASATMPPASIGRATQMQCLSMTKSIALDDQPLKIGAEPCLFFDANFPARARSSQ
jgi:hypothetical protein